jgi:hypothetical protein
LPAIVRRGERVPVSMLGKCAGGLLVVFLVLFVALVVGVNGGTLPRGTKPAITFGISTTIAAYATFITSVASLIKSKDRSPVVILAVVFGTVGVILFTMEMLEGIAG